MLTEQLTSRIRRGYGVLETFKSQIFLVVSRASEKLHKLSSQVSSCCIIIASVNIGIVYLYFSDTVFFNLN